MFDLLRKFQVLTNIFLSGSAVNLSLNYDFCVQELHAHTSMLLSSPEAIYTHTNISNG